MIGDGDLGEVVIEAKGRDVALFQASDGLDRESHLTTGRRRQGNLARGVDIAQGASPFRGMRHHESKHRMRRNPRWSRSPAAPQPHPRWKDAGVYVDDNRQRGAGGQRHLRQRFFRPWKSRWSEERGDQNGRSADSSSRRWGDFRGGCDDAA